MTDRATPASLFVLIITLMGLVLGCGRVSDEAPGEDVSLTTLLVRMTDTPAIAEQPLGRSFLVSSYDRSGGNQDWATWTQTGPDGRITLLDAEGPGYVSRIWTTNLKIDEWAFFFDGETAPRLTVSQDQLFNDQVFPFVAPLAGESGGGRYCLMPIPFAKHLRIAVKPEKLDPGRRNYFHINYTQLDAKHRMLESWPSSLTAAHSNAIRRAVEHGVDNRAALGALAATCLGEARSASVAPGKQLGLFEQRAPGRIDGLAIRINSPADSAILTEGLLRKLRLKMWWDGSRVPSVDVPLGDFFCNAFYTRSYASGVLGQIDGTFVSRLPMPFRSAARIVIANEAGVPVQLTWGVRASNDPGRGRLFHARWAASITSGQEFTMLEAQGPGHYIGCLLTAIGQDGSWTILEGDERLSPDPGEQPAQQGTGLEDYFNGAYYYTGLFDLPQHGLIEKGAMRTDQYRFHGLEAVAFDTTFQSTIEFGDQNQARGYLSSVAYWYADRPQDSTIASAAVPLLSGIQDRFELAGFMAQLFTLERAELWRDAAVRCDYMAARYADQPWGGVFRLRAAAYRERFAGFEAVKSVYSELAASPVPQVAQQAQDLLWFHEHENHALLGAHVRGMYKLWLDGREVGQGKTQGMLQVRRVVLPPGEHMWEVDITPTMQGSMFSLCLRTHWGDITSAGDWETVNVDPLPGVKPPEVFKGFRLLPNMTVWQFQPNGYVQMQSRDQVLSVWTFYKGQPRVKRARLRQSWRSGPGAAAAASPGDTSERSDEEEKAHAIN